MSKVDSEAKCIDKGCIRPAGNWPPAVLEKRAAVPVTEDQIRGTFRRFDANKDGLLSKQELQNAYASLGSRMPGVRAYLALKHADIDRDGNISEAEFEKLVKYTLKRGYSFK